MIDSYCDHAELIKLNRAAIQHADDQSIDQICRLNNRALLMCPRRFIETYPYCESQP